MNLPTLLTALGLIALTTVPAHASQSIVRVKCDREGALLFVNNKPKGKCSATSFTELFLKPGSYVISAKKEQPDKSYYYFEEKLEVYGDTVEKLLAEVKELRYPEQYYWEKCQKNPAGCFEYQKTYPEGQHIKQVNKIQANKPKPGAIRKDSTTGMEFVFIPGGCYQMGDTFKEGDSDEQPVHEVCVDDFWMGKYEVTQGQYKKIIGSNPSHFAKGSNYPVENVSWNDAQDFISKLNNRSDKQYRLPTEAQWEYAAREGGKKLRFGTGENTIGPSEANFDARQKYKNSYSRSGKYREKTVVVGSFSANSLGLYDMSGNVWEWCSDWYGKDYYTSSPRNNPQGPSSGSRRVLRGGSWIYGPVNVRAANRSRFGAAYRYNYVGFRLVSSGQ